MRSKVVFIVGLLLGVAVGGGVGVIAATSSSTVTVCANKTTSMLRYAKDGKCVSTKETKVLLNQMGTTGPRGATGAKGAAGSSFTARSVCGSNGYSLCAVGVQGPGGGTVFYVDTEGKYSDFDYLEVAPADASSGVEWSTTTPHCGLLVDTNCQTAFLTTSGEALNHVAIGTGRAATAAIVARHDAGGVAKTDYAAGVADAYATPTATDWFLPSRDELTELYRYVFIRPPAVLREGFTGYHHWSSSDFGPNSAWVRPFQSYFVDFDHSKSYSYYVRPVRAF